MDYFAQIAGAPDAEEAVKRLRGEEDAPKHLLEATLDELQSKVPPIWRAELTNWFYQKPRFAALVWNELAYCRMHRERVARAAVSLVKRRRQVAAWGEGIPQERRGSYEDTLWRIPFFQAARVQSVAVQHEHRIDPTSDRDTAIRQLANALKPHGPHNGEREGVHAFMDDLCLATDAPHEPPAFIASLLREIDRPSRNRFTGFSGTRPEHQHYTPSMLIADRSLVLRLAKEYHVPVPFAIAHAAELDQISETRRETEREAEYEAAASAAPKKEGEWCRCPPGTPCDEVKDASPIRHALSQNLVGLAFSGGGIRSATFNLGVLQALAKLDVLRHCDYLSTVSGGGYIGSWFGAWLHREGESVHNSSEPTGNPAKSTLDHMRRLLAPNRSPNPLDPNVRPIRYLREFSNYLTPQTGFFSADTWTMAAIYIRNLLLNLLVLIPLLAAALMIPRVLAGVTELLLDQNTHPMLIPAIVGLLLLLSALTLVGNLRRATPPRSVWERDERSRGADSDEPAPWYSQQGWIQRLVVLPLLIISWLTASSYWLALRGRTFDLPGGSRLAYWCDRWTVAGFAAILPHHAIGAAELAAITAFILVLIVYLTARNLGSRWLPAAQLPLAMVMALAGSGYLTWLPVLNLKVLTAVLRAPDPWISLQHGWLTVLSAFSGLVVSGAVVGYAVVRRKALRVWSPPWVSASVLVSAASSILACLLFLLGQFLGFLAPVGFLKRLLSNVWPESAILSTSLSASVVLIVFLTIFGATRGFTQCWPKRSRAFGSLALALVGSGLAAFGVFLALGKLLSAFGGAEGLWHTIAFGTPLTLAAFAFVVVIQLGLLGINFPDEQREWWSRLRAWTLIYSAGWTGLFLLAIYPPVWARHLTEATNKWGGSGAIALWILSTIAGVKTGSLAATADKKSRETANASPIGESGEPAKPVSATALKTVATVAPYIFVVGLLAFLSLVIYWSLDARSAPCGKDLSACYWTNLTQFPNLWLAAVAAVLIVVAAVFSWRIGINEFSMHHFYKNRLVRCYLGASRWQERKADWFTGFDSADDIWLKKFDRNSEIPPDAVPGQPAPEATPAETPAEQSYRYTGPYPIINAALNLVGGEDLAWQERKASSFTFTPKYCGYDVDRAVMTVDKGPYWPDAYAPTIDYLSAGFGPMLGTAMAISGAAANPNMGKVTTAASAFLMTVFNVRLGWWLPNPRMREEWTTPTPRVGISYSGFELFGLTDDKKAFVNVSDGGHFENLGIYELIRRGCRYIIACDGGQDGSFGMEDLGNVIRKCRTDFGVEIEISIDRIRERDQRGWSSSHCVVGTIRYPGVAKHCEHGRVQLSGGMPIGEDGLLVYLKPSISGDEPYDILEYYTRVREFPHESTADQWFNESQFESYRRLGLHIAETTFQRYREHSDEVVYPPQLFEHLRRYWYPPSPKIADYSTEHALEYSRIMETVRARADLKFLDKALFEDVDFLHGSHRDEFYLCNSLIQLIENVYADLDLEENYAHPHVGGWMRVFEHWAKQPPFQRTWKQCENTYAERFRNFYNDRLVNGSGE